MGGKKYFDERSDSISKELELVERMSSVTEELEYLVRMSKGKGKKRPILDMDEVGFGLKATKSPASNISKALLAVFRLLVVKNLMRGRLFVTSYNAGKEMGLSATIGTRRDFLKVTRRLGLGRIDLLICEPNKIDIRLYGGVTSVGVKKSPRPICFFEAGLFSGLLESMYRKKMPVKEIKCKSKGDKYCQFKLGNMSNIGEHDYPLYPSEISSKENLKLLASLASHSITAIENAIQFEKTRKQVVVDALTQVYNYGYFRSMIGVECNKAKRYKTPLTVFMLDVDDFKKLNDRYGHPCGDEVLKIVARILIKHIRDVDIVARYGGDEFALILPQTTYEGAATVANRILKSVSSSKMIFEKKKLRLTISLGGVTFMPKLVPKEKTIVDLADKALLKAKSKGKNNLVLVLRK